MSNSTRKGNKLQRKAADMLEAQGYMVQVSVRTSQFRHGRWFSFQNDFFNGFDIIATKLGEPVRWIQVTVVGSARARIKKADPIPLDLDYNSVEVWGWKGGQRRRHKTTGKILDRQYFQIYYKKKNWERSDVDKIYEH